MSYNYTQSRLQIIRDAVKKADYVVCLLEKTGFYYYITPGGALIDTEYTNEDDVYSYIKTKYNIEIILSGF